MRTGSPASGFTLVEVMVALAVVAVALPALMFSLNQQIDGTAYLRDKSLARMVASNRLNEIRLIARAAQQLQKGSNSGTSELAGREWAWAVTTTETVVPNFYRIEIEVSELDAPDNEVLFTLIGSLSGDLANVGANAGAGTQGGVSGNETIDPGGTSGTSGGPSVPDITPLTGGGNGS